MRYYWSFTVTCPRNANALNNSIFLLVPYNLFCTSQKYNFLNTQAFQPFYKGHHQCVGDNNFSEVKTISEELCCCDRAYQNIL